MKVYVSVDVIVDEAGAMHPKAITWEDGRRFEISSVSEVKRAASERAGGTGIRYTCHIGTKDAYLYYEGPRWFVDAKGTRK